MGDNTIYNLNCDLGNNCLAIGCPKTLFDIFAEFDNETLLDKLCWQRIARIAV
jgi:hypothetical protein